MTNKKKTYLAPTMKVVELDDADIIAESQGYNDGFLRINNGDGIELDEEEL